MIPRDPDSPGPAFDAELRESVREAMRRPCAHECKYCPQEDAHPDGFCICKRCRCRMGLSPKLHAIVQRRRAERALAANAQNQKERCNADNHR